MRYNTHTQGEGARYDSMDYAGRTSKAMGGRSCESTCMDRLRRIRGGERGDVDEQPPSISHHE
jgi:hypothetical protein